MSGADSAKKLLAAYNQEQYRAFTLNTNTDLLLPQLSSVPGVAASQRLDVYKKIIVHQGTPNYVEFITKNDQPHAFLWQTNADTLKKAVRWGIVKTHSITTKVIAAVGQYRVVAYERVANGMVSNSQAVKLKLLDLYQDRFEALQALESLVNKKNTVDKYKEILDCYIEKLEHINENLKIYFKDVDSSGLDDDTIAQIESDLHADMRRAHAYSAKLNDDTVLSYNEARGTNSIVEFVKQQMIHGLYELQGINQDITYSKKRAFALTRGELNDFIEDARKEIDDHQADPCNAVTAKHHGLYSADKDALITYDFSADELSHAREREVLLAISFIEGWDELQQDKTNKPSVVNKTGEEDLDIVTSTRWKNHRNLTALFKSTGFFILNIFKGIFMSTHAWEEESWRNANKKQHFHLVAVELRRHATPNEPMWRKPFKFFKQVAYAIMDVFRGVRDFGTGLVIGMPAAVLADWQSSTFLPSLDLTLDEASKAVEAIRTKERERLVDTLQRCNFSFSESALEKTSTLAGVEYALTPGEQNDILTAIARGLNGFSSVFSHNIYAKDPLAGLLFTAAYTVGVGAIFMPSSTASVFGTRYVDLFSNFSYSMGSSKLAAAVAGGTTQAEVFATGWDALMHGPSGITMSSLYRLGEDPLTVGAYFAAAYGLGYILANGIDGYPIPWLSEYIKADLGSVPETAYPFIGAKVAVLLYEALKTDSLESKRPLKISVKLDRLVDPIVRDRLRMVCWLSTHAEVLPKLEPRQLVAISRQIEALFSKKESESLNKLLYPEPQSSIAFQLFASPLAYIPAVLRFGVSLVLTFIAWGSEPHPWEPTRRAAMYLVDKIKKDLTRLIVFTNQMLYLPYTLMSSLLKVTASVITMAIGRFGGLFDAKPAHSMYKVFASLHSFFRYMGEVFYPAGTLKDVIAAHPAHIIKEIEDSYVQLVQQMGRSKKYVADDSAEADVSQCKSNFSLLSSFHQKKEISPTENPSVAPIITPRQSAA